MGGNAVPNVGAIHQSEINPTLRSIENSLNLQSNSLSDRLLGSAGKKEYSGDIDIAMDMVSDDELKLFFEQLRKVYGQFNVKKSGYNFNVAVPIVNFNSSYNERLPRTGKVQVDFLFGDTEFVKLFYYSAGDESKCKGVHRNIAISAVAAFTDRKESDLLDDQSRPIEKLRWKWSPNGFFKIRRYSKKNDNGDWIKKQYDEQISTAISCPLTIAEILFGVDSPISYLNSVETVVDACMQSFNKDKQHDIFLMIANNIIEADKNQPKVDHLSFDYPFEISQYFQKSDK